MSQTLTLELSEEVYTVIRRQAEAAGMSPADWVVTMLEQQQYFRAFEWRRIQAQRAESEKHSTSDPFARHFGEMGHSMSQNEWRSPNPQETLQNLIVYADTAYLSTVSEEVFVRLLQEELRSLVFNEESERINLQQYVDSHSRELYRFLRELCQKKSSERELPREAIAVD